MSLYYLNHNKLIRLQTSDICELVRIFSISTTPLFDMEEFNLRLLEGNFGDESLCDDIRDSLFDYAIKQQKKINCDTNSKN